MQPHARSPRRPSTRGLAPAAVLFAAWALPSPASGQAPQRDKIPLKVLYAGSVGSPRTDDFVRFLGEEFAEVGATAFTSFTPNQADGWDVVIFDCEIKPTERTIGVEQPPTLPLTYDRASVLIGGAGALVAERSKLKIDWL